MKADSDAGNAVGANGTPTFFINGRELVGAQPFPAFKTVIDEEIAKAVKEPATRELLANQAMQAVGNTPEDFAAFIQKDIAIWKAVAAAAKVAVE